MREKVFTIAEETAVSPPTLAVFHSTTTRDEPPMDSRERINPMIPSCMKKLRFALIGLLGLAALLESNPATFADTLANPYFAIKVVDAQTGRGVPLVELRTVNNISYYTDSNGIVAFHEPGLMDRKVFFSVQSHGYEFPKDGFGFAGTALEVKEGGRAELKIKRINLAERLYRITGEGIYRDSVLVGEPTPIREPLLNAEVTGQDSTPAVRFQGKLYLDLGRYRPRALSARAVRHVRRDLRVAGQGTRSGQGDRSDLFHR